VLVKSYKDKFIEGVHYYMEGERVIFMALFHLERGQCCGNGCRHCPFEPKHKKGTEIVKDKNSPEYIKFKENT
jgi:2-iminoacetate synthase ThiH